MEKLKAFFKNKTVMTIEAVLLGAAAVGLTVGGVAVEGITAIVSMSVAVLSAVDSVATLIAALFGDKKKKEE